MRSPFAYLLALCALTLLMSACTSSNDEDEDLPFFGGVRGVNAFPDIEDVVFTVVFEDFDPSVNLRLNYQGVTGLVNFSERNYTFTFDVVLPGDTEATLLAETTSTIEPETLYEFVLAGDFDDPQLLVWTQPRRDWFTELVDANDNGTEITELTVSFGHAVAGADAVDVYLEAPGTDPAATTPRSTIAFGELAPQLTLETDSYQLIVTAAGDPATVLFTSDELELPAASSAVFAIVDTAGQSTQAVAVEQIIDSISAPLTDVNAPAAISVIHAAPEASAVDVFDSEDFDTPLISGLAFADLSEDVSVPSGTLDLAVTPADDVGVVLAEASLDLPAGAYQRVFLAGLPGELQSFVATDDRRSFLTQGRIRAFNGATNFDTLDVYILNPGTDLSISFPAFSSLAFGAPSILAAVDPRDYELTLTETGTNNVIFGPVPFPVEAGVGLELIITDAAESTQADVQMIERNGAP